jgi:hypothetical protein
MGQHGAYASFKAHNPLFFLFCGYLVARKAGIGQFVLKNKLKTNSMCNVRFGDNQAPKVKKNMCFLGRL